MPDVRLRGQTIRSDKGNIDPMGLFGCESCPHLVYTLPPLTASSCTFLFSSESPSSMTSSGWCVMKGTKRPRSIVFSSNDSMRKDYFFSPAPTAEGNVPTPRRLCLHVCGHFQPRCPFLPVTKWYPNPTVRQKRNNSQNLAVRLGISLIPD